MIAEEGTTLKCLQGARAGCMDWRSEPDRVTWGALDRRTQRSVTVLLALNTAVLSLWVCHVSTPANVSPPSAAPASGQRGTLAPDAIVAFPGGLNRKADTTPFLGPPPDSNVDSWRLIDEGFVIGALAEVDDLPATALSADQRQWVLAWIAIDLWDSHNHGVQVGNALGDLLSRILTPSQVSALTSKRAWLERQAVDPDQVLAATRAITPKVLWLPTRGGGSASPRRAPPLGLHLAGVALLAGDVDERLTPRQASQLVAPLEQIARLTHHRVEQYAKLRAMLTDAQLAEMVQVLRDVQAGRVDPYGVFIEKVDWTRWNAHRPR